MILLWYTYCSWWIFIWFLLYILNIIPISSYIGNLFVFTLVTLAIICNFIYYIFFNEKQLTNYNSIVKLLLLLLLIDILPVIVLKKNITENSIILLLLILIGYCICMNKWKICILNHYLDVNFENISKYFNFKNIFLQSK